MSPHRTIDPAVKALVRRWAVAQDAHHGAKQLRDGRQDLDAHQTAQLNRELVDIALDILGRMLQQGSGEGETEQVGALAVSADQRANIAGWTADQRFVAEALGVDWEVWWQQLMRHSRNVIDQLGAPGNDAPLAASRARAARLLGHVEAHRDEAAPPTIGRRRGR